jgi:hypothetical protein
MGLYVMTCRHTGTQKQLTAVEHSIQNFDWYCHVHGVTVDGGWIGNCVYWTLWHMALDCTLQFPDTNIHILSIVTSSLPLRDCCLRLPTLTSLFLWVPEPSPCLSYSSFLISQ